MLISYQRLKKYIACNLEPKNLAQQLTERGLETSYSLYIQGAKNNQISESDMDKQFSKVTICNVIKVSRHPKANKALCIVKNEENSFQTVCGANNVVEGMKVAFAEHGSCLPGNIRIKRGRIRGIASEGMICSVDELGIGPYEFNIWEAPRSAKIGKLAYHYFPNLDFILDIETPSNRPDLLCLEGIIREIHAILKQPLSDQIFPIHPLEKINQSMSVKIDDAQQCHRYCCCFMDKVQIKDSPDWIKDILIKSGIQPINNMVDIANLVMLELGQPIHIFDANKLTTKSICIKQAKPDESFVGLDNKKYQLNSSCITIANEDKTIALAGILGAENSKVDSQTTQIIIESAHFNASVIYRTAKKLFCPTQASHLFSRGINVQNTLSAMQRCMYLIQEIAGGVAIEWTDCYPNVVKNKQIQINLNRIEKRLGCSIPSETVHNLSYLGFKVGKISEDNEWQFEIPGFRQNDIQTEIDLAEEIARNFGYQNIPSVFESPQINVDYLSPQMPCEWKLKNRLAISGFNEIYNYSFLDNQLEQKIQSKLEGLPTKKSNIKDKSWQIRIKNLNSENHSHLRDQLLQGLIQSMNQNIHQGHHPCRLFEFGRVFKEAFTAFGKPQSLYLENKHLAFGIYQKNIDFADVKSELLSFIEPLLNTSFSFVPLSSWLNEDAYLEKPFKGLNWEHEELLYACYSYFHPAKTACILMKSKIIGLIGNLHPYIQKKLKWKQETWIAELNLSCLEERINNMMSNGEIFAQYQPISTFPKVYRDLTVDVPTSVSYDQVINVINKGSKYLLQAIFKGIYYHANKNENKEWIKSLTFALEFQSQNTTLTLDNVDKEFNRIVNKLKQNCQGMVRGL